MKYYKDINNIVYAYELDGSQDEYIGDKIELTEEEINLHLNPPKTLEQLQSEAKYIQTVSLNTATVTTTSGKVFDARDKDLVRMISAINTGERNAITSTNWKLHDNTVVTITMDELKEAHDLTITQIGTILLG